MWIGLHGTPTLYMFISIVNGIESQLWSWMRYRKKETRTTTCPRLFAMCARACPKIDPLFVRGGGADRSSPRECVFIHAMSINVVVIVAPAWITITMTRFIKGRIDPPINYAALHKLASRETILSLPLAARSADRSRYSESRGAPRYAIRSSSRNLKFA